MKIDLGTSTLPPVWVLRLFQHAYAHGYAPEPEQKPICRQFSRCEGCPYPAHGFLCWRDEKECLRTRMQKINERKDAYGDQSGTL